MAETEIERAETTVTLRVFSEALGVSEIGAAMGIAATKSFAKGDLASARNPKSLR